MSLTSLFPTPNPGKDTKCQTPQKPAYLITAELTALDLRCDEVIEIHLPTLRRILAVDIKVVGNDAITFELNNFWEKLFSELQIIFTDACTRSTAEEYQWVYLHLNDKIMKSMLEVDLKAEEAEVVAKREE
jgi:hypothetical protein